MHEQFAVIEQQLRRGDVIELDLPSDASGFLLQDEQGNYCFVWETCHHGQDEEHDCVIFKTIEDLFLWLFSQLFSQRMTRQEAVQCYGGEFSTYRLGRFLSPS